MRKSKATLKVEEKKKLIENLLKLKDMGYTDVEIGEIISDYKQVVSNIKTKGMAYPISLEKARAFNYRIDNFISSLKE